MDNDLSTYCHTDDGGWVMVDLGEDTEIGGIFLYVYWTWAPSGDRYDRAIGLHVDILDASQNVVLTTTSITDGRRGYMLDFTSGFTSPNDTNQWRGLDQIYAAGDALDGWQQFVAPVIPKCDCCEAKLKRMGLATGSNCVVE